MMNSSPERIAWITLISAFCICLLSGAVGTFAGRWYVFESTTGLQVQLRVGRGTAGVSGLETSTSEEVVRINRGLETNDKVTTDEIAQGYIEFVDTRHQDRIIAHAVIPPGSQIRLFSATRPRYNLSDEGYQIHLGALEGRLEVRVPPALPQSLRIVIEGSHGTVTIENSGVYLIWSLPDSMTLIPRHSAALLTVENSETIEVPAGQTAQIDALQATVTVIKTTDELVKNSLFLNTTEPGVPDGWGCFSISENPDAVRGINQLQTVEGRRAMHIERRGETLGYGETGCLQLLGERQEGLDVSAYRTLRIRASLNIRWHSLAICGSQASECALMLELTYLNEFGQKQRWIHGFYTFEHTNPDLPRSCNSCLLEHDRITAGNWYIFESQNLFELPEGFRPTRLEKIRFYAAGHEYEVLVDEVAVLGER